MIPYIQAENLSKRFGDLLLFENISFTIFQDQKVALIAKNGTGKTTLLEILASKDTAEEGLITLTNNVKIGYLEQVQRFNPQHTVSDEIFQSDNEKLQVIREFEIAVANNRQEDISNYSSKIDLLGAWDIEVSIKQILSKLKITDLDASVGTLSGGQQKRLALAKVLINEPDLLIMDEPTNHLDLDMIEWLEIYLKRSKSTLLMVTHDRYFLDRVCNEIIEMDNNQIYRYTGNYSYYLEKREERIQSFQSSVEKARNLLKTELEWMRRMPKARGTKAKSRIDAFYELKEKASQSLKEDAINLSIGSSRLGKKIIEIEGLYKSFDNKHLIKDFSYIFSRNEKIGLIGDNGTGKSTFLNLITGSLQADKGNIEIGQTINFGYYRQEGIQFDPKEKVIDAVTKIAEYIEFDNGNKLTCSQLLNRFLFPPETQHSFIEKLSGGEQRRLYLCTVLMNNPNFLILDEPTNDLDIMTLNVLEEYLVNFTGCVIIVSHDRFFMDKIVDHLFVFDGKGKIKDFPGNYSIYREKLEMDNQKQKVEKTAKPKIKKAVGQTSSKRRLSFKEKREFEILEKEIPELEDLRKSIEEEINSGKLPHDELYTKSEQLAQLKSQLDEKELRWLELSEIED